MYKIIIGTTPTITYKFNVVSVSDITSAILTIKERGENVIEKSLVGESDNIKQSFTDNLVNTWHNLVNASNTLNVLGNY